MNLREPTDENVAEAARLLRNGSLVVIPTETVYGLAASIENESALSQIFEIKQRPADNPLIVHIAKISDLDSLSPNVSQRARALAAKFWPGPLTLVLEKRPEISATITAGGNTVAVRLPAHPIARELIKQAEVPIAAPSANRFMQLSPTRAEHVDPAIGDKVAMILDGGPCTVGIESTVVDCTGDAFRILRPGVLGERELSTVVQLSAGIDNQGERKSPGRYLRHYSPRTPLRIVPHLGPNDGGIVLVSPTSPRQIQLPQEPIGFAAGLYAALHELDLFNLDEILVQSPPETPDWYGVLDRLQKAASRS